MCAHENRKYRLYMIRTSGGDLYTGISTDVRRRLNQHQNGTGSKFLRGKGPLELLLSLDPACHSCALRAELQVKSMTKATKELFARAFTGAY